MELPTYFKDFLTEIRPTSNQVNEYKQGYKTLTKRLREDEKLSLIIIALILQGSYRRATAVRPKNGKRADVDVIAITKLSEDEYTPEQALDLFEPFLEQHYQGKYQPQGRSWGIELSYVDLDLVVTSAPSESEIEIFKTDSITTLDTPDTIDDWRMTPSWLPSELRSMYTSNRLQYRLDAAKQEAEWKLSPLRIPDRDAEKWDDTHPIEQIKWTWEKNRKCNRHYVNVVKALKWWRRVKHLTPKYPKGYPFEHLIGQSCPDGIKSVAEGVTLTLEKIAQDYKFYADLKIVPVLSDHGVPQHNVFHRVSGEDFAEFHSQVCDAAVIARQALDSNSVNESVAEWQQLFGNKFPDAPPGNGGSGSTSQSTSGGENTPQYTPSIISGGRFA